MAFAFVIALAHSCVKDQFPDPDPEDPEFVLSQTKIDVPSEGGEYKIAYTLNNPVEGEVIQLSEVPEWLYADTSTDNSISIVVSGNSQAYLREAQIKVCYASIEQTLSVTQEGIPFFNMLITEVNESDIIYDVIPADEEMTYLSFCTESLYYIDDESYMNAMTNLFKSSAQSLGISLKEYMKQLLRTGMQQGVVLDALVPGTDYIIGFVGYDNEANEYVTPLNVFEAETKSIDYVDVTLELSETIKATIVDMKVTPSDSEQYYMTGSAQINGDVNIEELMIVFQKNIYGTIEALQDLYPGTTVQEAMEWISYKGENTIGFERLAAKTEYVLFAVCVDVSTGYINSIPQTVEVTTGSVQPSDNEFLVDFIEINDYTAKANILTTNNDPYKVGYVSGDYFVGMTEDEIVEDLLSGRFTLPRTTKRGNYVLDMGPLTPDTDWYVFVYGWAEGVGERTTDVLLIKFRTLVPQLADCSLSLECGKYFDGDALLEAYPGMFEGLGLDISGKVVFPVKAIPSGNYDKYYYTLFDFDTSEMFSDRELNILLPKPDYGISAPTTYFVCTYEIPYDEPSRSLIGNAFDKDGKPGEITRIEGIVFTKDGVSPVSEFVPFDTATKVKGSIKDKIPFDRTDESLMATLK